MNTISPADYTLNSAQDCGSSFALISPGDLISATVSNASVMPSNVSALESVHSQMPGLRGGCFLSYLETPIL